MASGVSTSIMRDVNNYVFMIYIIITFITFNSTEIFHEHKIILILYASLHYTLSNMHESTGRQQKYTDIVIWQRRPIWMAFTFLYSMCFLSTQFDEFRHIQ